MLSIYFCDDNYVLREKYKNMILEVVEQLHEKIELFDFSSGEELLAQVDIAENPADIIYLDVMMHGINGIETAKKIRAKGWKSEIIFLTSSEEFMFDSFEVVPAKYCIKSRINEESFGKVLTETIETVKLRKSKDVVIVAESGRKNIHISEILYFIEKDGMTRVHCVDGTFSCNKSMHKIRSLLSNNSFADISLGCFINLRMVEDIGRDKVVLADGTVLPLESAYEESIKRHFSDFLTQLL